MTLTQDRRMPVDGADVYVPTAKGDAELHGGGTALQADQLDLLVRVDGRTTVKEIAAAMRQPVADPLLDRFRDLLRNGLIALKPRPRPGESDFVEFLSLERPAAPTTDAISAAGADAEAGMRALAQDRYYVRIARRAGTERKLQAGERPAVLVVEDEPHLAQFLRHYLAMEGFAARVASNRAEIVAALREPPLPALVLLDVVLPDADGFDILLRIKTHPVLKRVPVVMLTARATREAVLQGLARGADGYVTKPFEADALIRAVRSVLGIAES